MFKGIIENEKCSQKPFILFIYSIDICFDSK